MLELSPQSVTDYLRQRNAASDQPLLIQSLSGGVANVVLKIFDPGAGPKVGTDLRSPAQIKRNLPDKRINQGLCFVLKQPLPKFKTEAEWLVDIDRVRVERDCMQLLSQILPAGAVPDLLWFDEANYVLAMSCAPLDSVVWKKQLLSGRVSSEAAQQAGMLLAILHSSTKDDPALRQRYGDPKFFIQQRTDPYFRSLIPQHPALAPVLNTLIDSLLSTQHCLIHGDFSPKNILLIPHPQDPPSTSASPPPPVPPNQKSKIKTQKSPQLSHLFLLDFEVAFFGHCAFDVATLINHLLLKAFHLGGNWRAAMIAIDAFWQTYLNTVDRSLAQIAEASAGHVLGALLLARIDGKSPAEYLTDDKIKTLVRDAGRDILLQPNPALEPALDLAADALTARAEMSPSP